MQAWRGLDDRLFRHDWKIALNTARANFTCLHDRLIAGIALLAALAIARSWFSDQSWRIAAWAALGFSVSAGVSAGHLVLARLTFHSLDGVLATDALRPSLSRRYAVTWHGIALAILIVATLIVRPSLILISVPAYLAGVLVAGVPAGISARRAGVGTATIGRIIKRRLQAPYVGVVFAMILLLSLLPARVLETKALMAFIGVEAILFAALLASVDHNIVRFRLLTGHTPWRIARSQWRGLLLFAGVTAPACWLALGPVPAGVLLAISAAMLLLPTVRVFAYCAHEKRAADFLVSVLAGVLILVGYSIPVLLPFVAGFVLWQLQRRGAAKAWLLA